MVAHVVASPPLAEQGFPPIEESALTEIEAELFPDVVEALLDTPAPWTLITLAGNPALALIQLFKQRRAAAIVVGADTPGWTSQLRRLSTGSVPNRLAHEQHAPVIIIPDGCSRPRAKTDDRSRDRA